MSSVIHHRSATCLTAFALAMTAPSLAAAHSAGATSSANGHEACGSREHPIEVMLPFELQAKLFHSLPIAGLLVTPDAIAERVLANPLRATTDQPLTGNGGPYLVGRPGVVDTHADLTRLTDPFPRRVAGPP
jgi:hypothetical protein